MRPPPHDCNDDEVVDEHGALQLQSGTCLLRSRASAAATIPATHSDDTGLRSAPPPAAASRACALGLEATPSCPFRAAAALLPWLPPSVATATNAAFMSARGSACALDASLLAVCRESGRIRVMAACATAVEEQV